MADDEAAVAVEAEWRVAPAVHTDLIEAERRTAELDPKNGERTHLVQQRIGALMQTGANPHATTDINWDKELSAFAELAYPDCENPPHTQPIAPTFSGLIRAGCAQITGSRSTRCRAAGCRNGRRPLTASPWRQSTPTPTPRAASASGRTSPVTSPPLLRLWLILAPGMGTARPQRPGCCRPPA